MTTALIDGDWLIYAGGFINEERNIKVTHTPSGKVRTFKNRTEFWGGKRNEIGGWLGEINAARVETGKPPFTKEQFTIEDVQIANDISHALHTIKAMIKNSVRDAGCRDYKIFVGRGESFRVERSSLWKYKGQRENLLRPLLKDDILEYLVKHHDAVECVSYEADDMVIMAAHENPDSVVISPDKDTGGCHVKWYNPQHPEWGVIDCRCFGKLFLDEKDKIRGYGRIFKYFQIISQDDVDNYKANCFSDVKWGAKSAYNALVDAKTDREAWQIMYDTFNHLYPEEKVIIGWRGEELVIDSLYVFQEMFDMVHMHRWKDDFVDVRDVLKKMEILK